MDLLSRLQAAFGETYAIERELGGGGMSRVFLAVERALGRRVVIKVLPPEVAGSLNADRFRREIQVVASLQHPHILPVLAAGEAGGLLWYSMPHVEGQSLRIRLEHDGALPSSVAGRLMRDVADALQHAHQHGVVHRDIKPENILLSDSHAVVTDFGIAKALVTARVDEGGATTTEGMIIGTPMYMAPEQAAGDRGIDQRADVYALGAVGYEMLAGHPVFSRPTPQALIAAHIAEKPEPLPRSGPLAELVMRCLEKDPKNRPTAVGVSQTLEGLAKLAERPFWRRPAIIAVAVIIIAFLTSWATGLWPIRSLVSRGLLTDRDRILFANVNNLTTDSTLGLALTQALWVDLTQSDIMRVVSDAEVRQALDRARRDPGAQLNEALARELAVRDGIKAVIAAEVSSVGTGYVLSARIVSPADGNVLTAVRETARDGGELLDALGRLSRQLRRRTGESLRSISATPRLERVTTGSLEALRKYSQGLQAIEVERDLDRAETLFREALTIDSGFAMAWRKLGIQLSNAGKRGPAVAALTQAFRHRDRLQGTERLWTEASYYGTVTFEIDRAISAYRNILAMDSLDWRAINNLALMHQRVGRSAVAESLTRRALRMDSLKLTPYLNLQEYVALQGRTAEALAIVDTTRARLGEDQTLDWQEVQFRYLAQDTAAVRKLLAKISSRYGTDAEVRGGVALTRGDLATVSGQLAEARRQFQIAKRERLADGDLESFYDVVFDEVISETTIRRNPSRAITILNDEIRQHPIDELDEVDRPYLEHAYNYALAGRTDLARAMLVNFERMPNDLRRREEGFYRSILAVIAMAEGKPEDALAELDRSPAHDDCKICSAAERGRAWDQAGNLDSAIAQFQKYLTLPQVDRLWIDAHFLPQILERLGELQEAQGNRAEAIEAYSRLVTLWRHADPELQPRVSEIRRRLAALTAER